MEDESKPMGQGCRWPDLHRDCSCISISKSRLYSENIFGIFFVTIANFLGCVIFAVLFVWGPNCWLWKLYRTHWAEESRIDIVWLIAWMIYFPSTSVQSDRTWKSASFSHCMVKQSDTRYYCLLSQDGFYLPGCSECFIGSVQSY